MARSPIVRVRNFIRRFGELERAVAEVRGAVEGLGGRLDETAAFTQEMLRARGTALAQQVDQVLDAANYAARRAPLARQKARVLFLVHHIEAWDSTDGLVRALREDDDFDVVVASIPRHFRGAEGFGGEEVVHEGLEARGVQHIRITLTEDRDRLSLVRAIDPDLIFRQSQWDADIPGAFSTANLSFARLCLVPYETMNIIENFPVEGITNTAVDTPYHRAAWVVFCAGELNKEIAERDNARGGTQFVAAGHPKADRLRGVEPAWPISHEGTTPRAKVVWSAHHSIVDDWSNFGMLHLIAEDMLEWATAAGDVDFVFMVHPALPPLINDPASPISPERAKELLAAWDALPNTAVFTGGDYGPVLAASDLMIVDGLSMLVEYQFMNKPLIHLSRPGHRDFNDVGEIVMTGAHVAHDVHAARQLAEGFFDGAPDPLAQTQRENITRLFGDQPSVPRIVDAMRGLIALEQGQN